MFEKPTINDFLSQLYMQRDQAVAGFGSEVRRIKADMSRRGLLRSSMTITAMLDAMFDFAKSGTAAMLGELRRAVERTDLDASELRQLTRARLNELLEAILSAASWDKVRDWTRSAAVNKLIDDKIQALRDQQGFWIRQFEVGFDEEAKPELIPNVTNVLHAGNVVGGIQQGTIRSEQSVAVELDFEAISAAAEAFENELQSVDVPADALNEVRGDLATIKAQLAKPRPSLAILREAGKSIRNVCEGMLGGILSAPALLALSHLAVALGV